MAIVRCHACDGWFDPTDGEYDDKTLEFTCHDCQYEIDAEEEADAALDDCVAKQCGAVGDDPLDKD